MAQRTSELLNVVHSRAQFPKVQQENMFITEAGIASGHVSTYFKKCGNNQASLHIQLQREEVVHYP